jgi:hypothetical protein
MPHSDPDEACSIVIRHLPEIPVWPQLSGRSSEENMVIQFSEGFPGVVIDGDRFPPDMLPGCMLSCPGQKAAK